MQTSQEIHKGNHLNSNSESELLIINRNFNAPVEELFKAFTNSPAIKAWWWPKDLYADRVEYDFREGGKYFINMKGFVHEGGMTGKFEKIEKNKRIVMSDHFADEEGNVVTAEEAGMTGNWPKVGYITLEFDFVNDNLSHLKLSQQGIPNESQKECIQGWDQSFDKLTRYLDDRTK